MTKNATMFKADFKFSWTDENLIKYFNSLSDYATIKTSKFWVKLGTLSRKMWLKQLRNFLIEPLLVRVSRFSKCNNPSKYFSLDWQLRNWLHTLVIVSCIVPSSSKTLSMKKASHFSVNVFASFWLW